MTKVNQINFFTQGIESVNHPDRIKGNYSIAPIPFSIAYDLVIEHHYLHRRPPCSYAFGLFYQDGIIGCIIYGTPSSSSLREGICGYGEKDNVIELSRLWVHDEAIKNSESYLIANTLPLIDKEIVVSYADPEYGHIGVVYQATNWIYTGLSAKRTDWVVDGLDVHSHTLADKYTSEEIRDLYGDRFRLVDRSRKHRYVFFNTKCKKRKNELMSLLSYNVMPYPKKAASE